MHVGHEGDGSFCVRRQCKWSKYTMSLHARHNLVLLELLPDPGDVESFSTSVHRQEMPDDKYEWHSKPPGSDRSSSFPIFKLLCISLSFCFISALHENNNLVPVHIKCLASVVCALKIVAVVFMQSFRRDFLQIISLLSGPGIGTKAQYREEKAHYRSVFDRNSKLIGLLI